MNKTNTTTNSKYTYADLARDIIAWADGDLILTDEQISTMRNKAVALLDVQTKKAEYNAEHKSAKAPKGASAETKARADAIRKVLTGTPMTASEISNLAGVEYTALQVANAVKYIDGAKSCKVIRETVNAKGLKAQKEYTAYFID